MRFKKFSVKIWYERLRAALLLAYPYLIVLAYTFLALEFYIYPGFLDQFIFIDSKIFTFVVIGLWFLICTHNFKFEKHPLLVHVLTINKLFTPVFIFLSFLFKTQEERNYPNYTFSHYHVHPEHFRYFTVFNITLTILYFVFASKSLAKLRKKISLKDLTSLFLILVLVLWIALPGSIGILSGVSNQIRFVSKHPNITYSGKLEIKLGPTYRFIHFVEEHTPKDSVVAVPPQENPWLTIGNVGYVRYFLYPRTIISPAENNDFSYDHADYIVIARGEWAAHHPDDYGWPKATIEAERMWYFDRNTGNTEEIDNSVFDPTVAKNKNSWGLIERKQE